MFITDNDYRVVVGESALTIIAQASPENREGAEAAACEEIAGYLRPKYDTEGLFAQEDDRRNRQLVMITCDIALYHMAASGKQRMGMEIRKERYDRAIRWLEQVQAGKVVPQLPLTTDDQGNITSGQCSFASETQLRHNW